ncbi:oxidoreductase [Halolactibacillus alkaliphilus]|uniref:Oxidoreductase n=1 Tax=Halolactibacillus alkaliphilus TaxID=442899 RepID=A0A511WZP1_9BACI|nr:Gfo/Idh/MocA family oxidoreductase [Halolactibacillus alkaliphilus]GEN56151.1 oxidoreductase [Halolactibacillus alkaliphilus]GGN66871.1 oxidoreductase [Halolactibacillus alkaliphilus]SFO71973.1 Predicted dehydrogenase [Halolactibacillus alkaliphilus]
MTKNLRVAIIGCGRIFPMHAASVVHQPDTKLVAVCDIDMERALEQAKLYKCEAYPNYINLFNEVDIDVIHICLPHYLHEEITIEAAKRGIHVLTEKPISISNQSAEKMISFCEDCNVKLGVIFQSRYNHSAQLVKSLLTKGELGHIHSANLILTWNRSNQYYSESDWKGTWDKEGGGVVIDQAIHSFDLLNWFIDSEIDFIDASIHQRVNTEIEVEDTAEGIIKYKNNTTLSFYTMNHYSYDAPIKLELDCEKALVKFIGSKATITFNDGREYKVENDPRETIEYSNGTKDYWGVSHVKQITDFYNAIKNNEQLFIDGNQALKTQRIVSGIYQSAKNRQKIYL